MNVLYEGEEGMGDGPLREVMNLLSRKLIMGGLDQSEGRTRDVQGGDQSDGVQLFGLTSDGTV